MTATASARPDPRGLPGWVATGVRVLAAAGLAMPVVGALGLTAKSGADSFLDLPTTLTVPPLPQASKVLDARGGLVATLRGDEDREIVPLSRVPKVLQQAVIDIEDT